MDHNNFDYENSFIIKPPTEEQKNIFHNNTSNSGETFILIDTRDRNLQLYPDNNEFTIKLEEPINQVNEIELISANMPNDIYNINTNNNRIYFIKNINANDDFTTNTESTQKYYIEINPGKYTYETLINTFNNTSLEEQNDKNLDQNLTPEEQLTNESSFSSLEYIVYKYPNNDVSNEFYAKIKINYNFNKFLININLYNITDNNINSSNNLITFRGQSYNDFNNITNYNYLPCSSHEIFGFDLNFGYDPDSDYKNYMNFTNYNADNFENEYYKLINYNLIYDNDEDYSFLKTSYKIIKEQLYNSSNTHANINSNDYVLLHLDNFPKFTNKISSSNIIQNSYAKLHLGQSTRNIFFGRIKAFTNVYKLNPPFKLSKLSFKFTDYYGNNFNFNNVNFSLTFCINYNKNPTYYNY